MMKVLIKKILFLGIVCLLATCDKDRLPTEPEEAAQGQIVIVFEEDMPGPGLSATLPDSLSKTLAQKEKVKKEPRLSAVDQLEVRVLQSDNTQIASQTSTVSEGRFKGSITVTAQNNLKVLLTGKNSGVIERFAMDSDVDVFAGQTTTVTISTSEWTAGYIPKITGISPNPSPDGSYTVSWIRVSGATGYVLQEAANTNFTGASTAYSGSNTYVSISGKSQGTYYYRVQATNEYNVRSGWSESQSVLDSISVPTLIDPGSSVSSGESYYVSWNSVSEAASYTIEEATNTSFSEATSHTVTDTSYKFSHSVSSTTTYYYRLKTNTATGSSGWSSTVDMIVNSISIAMVSIPAGSFQMGSNTGLDTEKPVHMVTLTAFEMSEYEITQAQYEAITGVNPSYFTGDYNRPVENVSWYDAVTFCNQLSESEGLESCYDLSTWECDFSKNGYRLPTEAEWEYAARAGTSTNYYTGNSESELDRAGWYSGNSGNTTHPVGGKENNAFGLYDMHGNVWEFCNDWFSSIYYSQSPGWNPAGPQTGASRAVRGGCWGYGADYSRSASRGSNRPDGKDLYIGFRVVRGSFVPGTFIEIPLLNDPGVSLLSGESYTLSWSSVSGATSYTIEEATDSSFTGASTQTMTGTSQSFSHSVSSATTYYYRVKTNTATGSSGWSNTVDMLVNPPPPGTPVATDPGSSVASGAGYTVSWSSVTGAASYTIEEATNSSFSGATSQTVSGTSQSFSRIVSTATTYYYRVKANNAYGSSGWSNTVDMLVNPPPPGAPVATDPGSSVASGASCTVSWSSVTGAASYTIEESTDSSFSGATSQTVSGTSQSFSHSVSAATTYYYRVKANSEYGSSGWSNTVDMLVNPPPPGMPVATDPGSSVASGESYTVSWSSVTGATSYTIEEATNSSFSGSTSQTVSGTSQSFSHNVSSATTYYYRVKANSASGSSGWSNTVDMVVNPQPPGTPVATDPGSSVASGASYTVSWSSVTGAASYTIEEATNNLFSGATSQTVSGISQSFSHDVSTDTTYYYRVKANSAYGSSGWSNTVDMLVNPPPPGAPVVNDPGSSAASGASYTVSWSSVTGAASYTIEEATNSSFSGATSQTVNTTSQSFSRSVSTITTYYYRVKANNAYGSSGWSNVVDIIVNPLPPGTPVATDPGSSVSSGASYTVSWSSVSGATSYTIEEATNSSFSVVTSQTVSSTSQSFSHSVSAATTYYYRVKANSASGSSGWSNTVDIIVNPLPPGTPVATDPGSSVNSGASYTVSWSSVTGAASYTIEEAINSSFTGATSQTVSGTSQSFSHNVSSATTYYYRVKANNAYGSSGWSNTVDMVINPPPPGTPSLSDPGSSVASGYGYSVSWSSVTGATSYTIEEATNSSFSGATSQTVSSTEKVFYHNVNSATTYYYRVRANSASGSSGWSSTVDMLVNPPTETDSVINISVPEQPNDIAGATLDRIVQFTLPSGNIVRPDGSDSLIFISFPNLPAGSGIPSGISSSNVKISLDNISYYQSIGIVRIDDNSIEIVTPLVLDASTSPRTVYVKIIGFINPSIPGTYGVQVSTEATPFPATKQDAWTVESGTGEYITMVSIPAGTFQMGSNTGYSDEQPVHSVTLTAFQMSQYEITQGQYQDVVGTNPSSFTGDDNRPVEQVSWYDAVTFCNKLSETEGLQPCYNLSTWACDFTKNGYRLPTEAEREYACRAWTTTNYYTGDSESDLDRAGWYYYNSGSTTHAVGGKQANAFGLYDMHGNVYEWCHDWYGSYGSASQTNPTGPASGSDRVRRGGSWGSLANVCRSADRRGHDPDYRFNTLGFRVVRR